MLDLTSFDKAIAQLEDALRLCSSPLVEQHPELANHLRAAAIQAFEFTFELAPKVLRRYLMETEANKEDVRELSFNNLFRLGYERGLVASELSVWKGFRDHRSATSHVYLEAKAQEVFAQIPAFLVEAQFLRDQLKRRLANEL